MAAKTLTTTFSSGTTITRFTTNIQDVIDSLKNINDFVLNYTYKKLKIDGSYYALGIKTTAGATPSSTKDWELGFGDTYVDGYNAFSASELVIDDYRIFGLVLY